MARLARIAVPHLPYHVTQRGNRRQPVFLREADYGKIGGVTEGAGLSAGGGRGQVLCHANHANSSMGATTT